MASTSTILSRIDRRLGELQSARDMALQAVSDTHDAIVREQLNAARAVADLAKVQIGFVADGEVDVACGRTARIEEVLEERAEALRKARRERDEARSECDVAVKQETEAAAALEALREQVDARWADIDRRLLDKAEYAEAEALAASAMESARSLREKADLARSERDDKAAPYLADALFSYLLGRGYGTEAYRQSTLGFVQRVDGWVAATCGFEEAHRNLKILTELPDFIDAMARRKSGEAEELAAVVQQLRQREAADDGVAALEAQATHAEERAAVLEEAASAARSRLLECDEKADAYDRDEDPAYQSIQALLVDTLRGTAINELERRARATSTEADDVQVRRIRRAREQVEHLAGVLEHQESVLADAQEKVDRVATVRKQVKRKGASSSSAFDSGRIDRALDGYLLGAITGMALSDTIDASHSITPSHYSASSSFGASSIPTSSFSGGGFSSGGGFGGGDFSSGGGF